MSLIDSMPHRAAVYRLRAENDEYGASRLTRDTVSSSVACWVQTVSMAEALEFQKQDMAVSHKVYLQSDPGLRPGDELVVSSGPSAVGETLIVQAFADASGGMGSVLRVLCRQDENKRASSWGAS